MFNKKIIWLLFELKEKLKKDKHFAVLNELEMNKNTHILLIMLWQAMSAFL